MKKMSMVVLGLMISSPAWAMSYSIDLEAQINGAKPVKGSVVVNEGEEGAITFQDTTIKFIPTQASNGSVRIQAEIFKKTASGLEIVSKPSVVTLLNEAAEITQQQKNGTETFRLKLTPKKAL